MSFENYKIGDRIKIVFKEDKDFYNQIGTVVKRLKIDGVIFEYPFNLPVIFDNGKKAAWGMQSSVVKLTNSDMIKKKLGIK